MRVHVIGIGGYGMRALAHVLLDRGVSVSGSDVTNDAAALDPLRARGAHINIGHDAQHVVGADVCVYSSAIDAANVERVAAQEMGMRTMHRAEMLAQWLHESECSVTVTGAHGKTTTSAMIATICTYAQEDPTFVIGADLVQFGRASKAGNGRICIAEADESDNTFVQYRPDIAVITNIEPDHLENYNGDFQVLIQAYQKHISNVRKTCIVCIDDPLLAQWARTQETWVTYGVHAQADVCATDIVLGDRHVSFACMIGTTPLGRVHVPVSGMHNVTNALGAIAAAAHSGIAYGHIVAALATYRGTKRRFEVHYEDEALMVVDDYAHHPTEIQATIRAARATNRRVIAVFEPQRYTRTASMFDAFATSFDAADVTIITDIYAPAGEQPIADVHAERLVACIQQHTTNPVYYAKTYTDAATWIDGLLRHGDVVLTMGAGPIYRLAQQLAKKQNALHRS
ncbi:MAG: UDP-N-acetylmuramate--L-alanine ligase [Paenibacillaceae bacterium]|nr:UDP-N-acetylmuramate--L-alanine ligase [Paenibacillaceae bacterium]